MPTPTYTPLANITLSSNDSQVDFGSIPNSYRDLILVVQYTANGANDFAVRLNSDTANNYSYVVMLGNGSTTASASATNNSFRAGYTAGSNNVNIFQFQDYAVTDKHKSVLWRVNEPGNQAQAGAGRWASTSAITSISLFPIGTSFASGSSFALYGVIA